MKQSMRPWGTPRSSQAADDRPGENGSVTVEFAIVLPTVVVLVALCVAAVGVSSQAIRLSDAASVVARQAGRGDEARIASTIEALAPAASISIERGDLTCVRLRRSVSFGPFGTLVPLDARSCAPSAGR